MVESLSYLPVNFFLPSTMHILPAKHSTHSPFAQGRQPNIHFILFIQLKQDLQKIHSPLIHVHSWLLGFSGLRSQKNNLSAVFYRLTTKYKGEADAHRDTPPWKPVSNGRCQHSNCGDLLP